MRRLAVGIFCFIFFTCSVFSQKGPAEKSLEEVYVSTPFKIPIFKSKLPADVSIVYPSERRYSGMEFASILGQQEGIRVNGSLGNLTAQRSTFFRGAASNQVLFLIDGIPMSDLIGNQVDVRAISANLIERIEIIPGGQSVLYGTNATAGAINLITKTPPRDTLGVGAGFSYGSYNTWKYNFSIGSTVGKLSYLFAYDGVQSDGISDASNHNKAEEEKDPFGRNSFMVKLKYALSKNISLSPFFRYSKIKIEYDDASFVDSRSPSSDRTIWQAGIKAEFKIKNGVVNVLYAANKAEQVLYTDKKAYSEQDGLLHNADVFLSYNIAPSLKWLIGVQLQQFNLIYSALKPTRNAISVNPYTNFLWTIIPKLNVQFGSRAVWDETYGIDYMYNIAANYAPSQKVLFFASHARAYTAPNLNQLYGTFGSNPNLLPEVSQTVEAGAEAWFLQRRLDIKASGFLRDIYRIITYGAYEKKSGYHNGNRQDDHGVDLRIAYYPRKNLRLSAWYEYVAGAITKKNSSGKGDTSYYNLTRRPRHSANLSAEWSITPRLQVGASAFFYDKRNDEDFDPQTYAAKNVILYEYFLLNLNASYSLFENKLIVYAALNNATDTRFFEVYGYSSMGINATVGVRFSY